VARDPGTQALRELIDPDARGPRIDAHHRLIWSAFADGTERRRDFLWRDEGGGRFIALSARPPAPTALFEPPEVKPFAPDLRPGDRLSFVLRANATRTMKSDDLAPSGKRRRRHRDVVMELLHEVSGQRTLSSDVEGDRATQRPELAGTAAKSWMEGQGARSGFAPLEVVASGYDAVTLPGHADRRAGAPRLGILDLSGGIEVRDPAVFLERLAAGFGRAKAFGCGLMLIRRA
jgi:CRISPR system Cascade subunit CasE